MSYNPDNRTNLPLGKIPQDLATYTVSLTDNSRTVMEKRYVRKNEHGELSETIQDVFWRVASNVAVAYNQGDAAIALAREYFKMLADLDFLPNTPTFTGAGTPLGNLSACFVLPLEDDMGKSDDGIFQTLRNAALIQQAGGGNGFSFSRLRAKGALVKSSNGVSTGPIGFLQAFDKAFDVINQGGVRRCANMGVLSVHHPDIKEFITCKADETSITNFNISVAITDDFMDAVVNDTDYDLIEPSTGETVKQLRAHDILDLIAEYAHRNGEPGVLFMDQANRGNPIPHIGRYEATNPCGEQNLLGYESCNLGSINLANHVKDGAVDWDKLQRTIEMATQFLDNVIEVNKYVEAVPQLREAALRSRRIGLGFMGLADMMIHLGLRYGSVEGQEFAGQITEFIRYHCMKTSVELAKKFGSFLAIEGSIYDPNNLTWIPPSPLTPYQHLERWNRPVFNWTEITEGILRYGIRNAAQTTIAPTGTIATIAGCEGYGCEPIFALAYVRHVLDGETRFTLNYGSPLLQRELTNHGLSEEDIAKIVEQVNHSGSCQNVLLIPEKRRNYLVVSADITPDEHVLMQSSIQAFIDNSISKTINMPSSATIQDVKDAYVQAWKQKCNGLTVYVAGSREKEVLQTEATQAKTQATQETSTPALPNYANSVKLARPKTLTGYTHQLKTPAGTIYLTINEIEDGDDKQPFEVFINSAKAGSEIAAISEAIGRLISLLLRQPSNIPPIERVQEIVEQLKDIGGGRSLGFGPSRISSFPDGVAHVLQQYADRYNHKLSETVSQPFAVNNQQQYNIQLGDICPSCGETTLIRREGCISCHSCGYSEC